MGILGVFLPSPKRKLQLGDFPISPHLLPPFLGKPDGQSRFTKKEIKLLEPQTTSLKWMFGETT